MKKLLLVLFTVLSFSIVSAQDFIQNHIYYTIVPGTNQVSIEGSINVNGDLIIPSNVIYNGVNYTVVSIGNFAFANSVNLTSVIIPDSITSIGNSAFYYCYSLSSVTIPSSVTFIGNSVFAACYLTSITCNIVIPLVIDNNVFYGINQSICSLIVPPASLSAYQAAITWQDFYSINGILNIDNFIIKNNLQLYPNPTKNELLIDIKNLTNTQLEVMDITGKILFNQTLNFINTIDTSNLSNGMYLFKVTSDEGSLTTKVIKN